MRHAFPLGAALGLLAFAAAQPATAASPPAAPLSTPVPGITGAGDAIARAADGSMWLTEPGSPGRIARVTKQGVVTEYVGGTTPGLAPSRSPQGFAITPDGYGWFLQQGGDDELGQIALDTGAFSTFLVKGGTPTSIAAGADGKLWVTGDGDNGESDFVAKYDRAAGTTTSYTTGLTANSKPTALTAGSDGALWFASESGSSGQLGRIATDGTITFRGIGSAATTLGVGPTGALWFGRGKELGLFDEKSPSIFATSSEPAAIATGPDGALWSATKGGAIRVVDGVATTHTLGLDASAKGIGLASGDDGRLWMTLDRAPFLVRITVPPYLGGVKTTTPSTTTASVTSDVRANGLLTTVVLQSASKDGSWTTLGTTVVGDGLDLSPVQFAVSDLTPGVSTSLRVVASNSAGETATSVSVKTDAPPTPTPTATPTLVPEPTTKPTTKPFPVLPSPEATPKATPVAEGPSAAPAPVQGSTVVVRPDRGIVTYKVPGSDTVRTIDGAASIPTGSTIDTTNGAVALSSRVEGKEQIGLFHGGQFKVKQVKTTGLTQLYLNAPLDCPKAGEKKAVRASAAAKKRKRRAVWGEDNKGKFETHGKDSVATVRGTKWLTTDTCGGTVVKVFEGAVSVRPTHGKGKAVLVKAGGRHVTRPAR